MKKLKIKFWKAEKALAMQILEQEGLPKVKEEGLTLIDDYPRMFYEQIYLRGTNSIFDYEPDFLTFSSNQERDEYLEKITNAITDEIFSTETSDLKVGEMCEVKISDVCEWATRKLLAILPEEQSYRYICNHSSLKDAFTMCKYARPLAKRTEPKVEECGELITYTWEEE